MTTVSEIFETMAYGPAPESDKPAVAWLDQHGRDFGLFVGGRWIKSKSGDGFDVINPATTARLARVTQAGEADVDAAVAAARKAFPAWSALSGHAAQGAMPRREGARGGAARGRAQCGDGGRADGRADREPQRHRQDRVHRLDRGGAPDPQGHGGIGEEALARARRKEPVHRVRRRRPG